MTKSSQHSSTTKFLSLIKQSAAIEFEIVPKDFLNENLKVIREVANGDSVILKNQALNTYQRAQRRQQLKESRQQNNLEQIFSLAIEYIGQDIQFDRMDLDWMSRFIGFSQDIHSPTLQDIWAKIISVELAQAGSFSLKSLKTLSELSTKEALLFYNAVNLCCKIGEDRSLKIITGAYKKPTLLSIFNKQNRFPVNLAKLGLSFTKLMTLASIGLIYEQEIESIAFKANELVQLSYQNETQSFQIKQNEVMLTYYKLTQTGEELSKLVSLDKSTNLIAHLKNDFGDLIKLQNSINTKV